MYWRIVKAERLPFGKRILRRGCRGDDVGELQQRLAAAGFYCGVPDGCFGILTEEAVRRLQQTFKLRQDGVVGPAVTTALIPNYVPAGRLIYTVKPGDSLTQISARFGVLPLAWRKVPGSQSGVRRIYPGQQLLLYRKAFFIWDETPGMQTGVAPRATGIIESKTLADLESDGDFFDRLDQDSRYCLLKLTAPDGTAGQLPSESGVAFLRHIKKRPEGKIGLDFRAGMADTLLFRDGWLHKWLRALGRSQLTFAVLSLVMTPRGIEQLFWEQLDWVGRYARMIMIEPVWDESAAENLQISVELWEKTLSQFAKIGARKPVLLVLPTHAWNWDEDQVLRHVAFPEVKLIRALYTQNLGETLPGRLAVIRYLSQGKQQLLLYRERAWWERMMQQMIKSNFAGLVIRDFGALGDDGPELIAAAFSVMPEGWLQGS